MANVLLHTLLFPPDGNSNAYIMADIALELQKRGHKVTVITTTPHYGILQDNLESQPFSEGKKSWYKKSSYNAMECYHIVVPSEKGGVQRRLATYVNFHRRALKLAGDGGIKADVVITQSPPLSIGIINALIGKKKGAKSVYIVQDLFPDGPIAQGRIGNRLVIKILRAIEKSVYKRNDAIIAITDGIRGHLERRVPAGKLLRTIPNFADTGIYHPMPAENFLADELNIKGKFVISYVGNIGNAHDLSPILFCARELGDLDIEFVIAGNGIKADYYINKAREEDLRNVRFIGYRKREDTPLINAFSDVCLVMLAPHVKDFSFPSKIYTLMAMAKPIIVMCPAESGAAGFVTGTNSGWAVESGHCGEFTALVKKLYYNRELLNRSGASSLKTVQAGYTKEHAGRRYDELIKELCDERQKDLQRAGALYRQGNYMGGEGAGFLGHRRGRKPRHPEV